MTDIATRLEAVRDRVASACRSAGRDPAEVTLVAVSKRHGPEAIRAAYAAGQRVFGENYVQEMLQKAEALRDLPDLRFHFIGHLQRNKAKAVRQVAACVETLDSGRLADALAKAGAGPSLETHADAHAEGAGLGSSADASAKPLPVYLQVNVAREEQKAGCLPEELDALLAHARSLPSLRVEGLMTVPPADDAEAARPWFRALRELAAGHGLSGLSMGMSGDLEVAIEEGATIVRVGTAIFGARV